MSDGTKKGSSEDKELAPKQAAREAVADAEPSEDAPVFSKDRLLGDDSSTLVGYPPHVVAGALEGVNKNNLTVEETKAAVKAWLDAPVKGE